MESNKYSLVWSDKPTYLSPERLLKIKENFPQTTFVAHITDDVLQVKTMINEIDKVLSIFDYVFTPNKFNIAEFPEINFIYQINYYYLTTFLQYVFVIGPKKGLE